MCFLEKVMWVNKNHVTKGEYIGTAISKEKSKSPS